MEPNRSKQARRAGCAALALGVTAWAAFVAATRAIPSPARETRFIDARGEVVSRDVHCHGAVVADGARLWSLCEREREGATERALARFDVATGQAALLGPLPGDAFALLGAARAPDDSRAVLLGDGLYAVEGDVVRPLGKSLLALGLARVGDAFELVDRSERGEPRVRRFAPSGVVERRLPGFDAAEGRTAQLEHAWHDGRGWRVVGTDRPARADALPFDVTIRERFESESPRALETLSLGAPVASLGPDGASQLALGWLQDGGVLRGSIGLEAVFLRRGERFERVFAGERRWVETVGMVLDEGPHARLLVTEAIGERFLWLDGARFDRVEIDGRFAALRVGARTGPRVVASFWLDPGVRILPAEGGHIVMGALGSAYVRVGRDLARTDPLSLGERAVRLFRNDRAKRNADFFLGFGALRAATIPLGLCGPLVGLVALVLARRRPRLAAGLAYGWLALAALGAWHFAYVLRFYW